MIAILLGLGIGVVAGLRPMTALAAVSWAASRGWIELSASWLAFLGYRWTPWVALTLALAELLVDLHPRAPRRTAAPGLTVRVVIGAIAGAAFGVATDAAAEGLAAGVVGALAGAWGGAAARARLADAMGRDRPAALLEDAVAITAGVLLVAAVV